MEKGILSIVLVLKQFCTMLLGAKLLMCTDHKNLTSANLNCHFVCRFFVKEFGSTILYRPDKKNVNADAISDLPCNNVMPIPEGTNAPDQYLTRLLMVKLLCGMPFQTKTISHNGKLHWLQ